MVTYNYDIEKYPFLEIMQDILDIKELDKAHEVSSFDLLKRENDQSTIFHRKYYDNFDRIQSLYESFITDELQPIFSERLVYQKIPTFRVQIPNNIAVGEWHKDRQYNHNQNEINIFFPFTDAFDTNTIWVESEEDKGDFAPIETGYGQFVIWNGCHLTHGNKTNITGKTRISVDFRVIPLSKWEVQEGSAINTKMKFDIGEYYKLCK